MFLPCPSVDIVNRLSFEPSTMLTLLGVLWKQSGALGFNDDLITCNSSLRKSLQSANSFIGSSAVRSLKSDVLKSFSLISFSFSFESFEKNLTAT